ncbi:hypothetical protein LTR10_004477 [Elasticomyces elasticus]|nr:hypothetical protein LTR10_004477 [Elasticomyces elasticus]KAK4976796.1 hypothetical protein LTR42_002841 [Elasticomyces elasticus]
MATASSDPSSTAADAQTWVYPPGGAPYPPLAATSNFGPVHQLDWMIMQWTPSNTPDELHLVCLSALSGAGPTWTIAHLPSPPFQYQFDVNVPLVNSSDTAICHLYFVPSRVGNTVVWEYINSKATSGITTYSSGAVSSTSVPTVAVTTPIGLAGVSSSTTATTSPDPSSSASSYAPSTTVATAKGGTRLSNGASAGIGVGVALGAIAIAAVLAFVLWRRKKSNRQQWQAHSGADSNQQFHEGKDGTGNVIYGGELQGNASTVAELDDTRALRMAKHAASRELAGHEVAIELPR